MFEDYYKILGIDGDANQEEIKKAYRELAKKYHPDVNLKKKNTEEVFKRISMAYNTLSDPVKKSSYDAKREYYLFREVINPNASPPPIHPQRRSSSIYETKKREYTPHAWMYGKIVIFLIITAAFMIPYGIYHYSSVYHYNTGRKLEYNGEYTDAYNSYLKALSRWGARNLEASYRAGSILLNRGASSESIPFFQSCYDFTNSDSVETWLKYKLAQAYSNIGQFDHALEEIKQIDQNGFLSDSSTLLSAEIRIFRTRNFREGIRDYQKLVDKRIKLKESWFGIGWGHQNLFRYPEAIYAFTECLKEDPEYAIALYYRGSAHYYNSDSISACTDFLKARDLGYPSASSAFSRSCEDSLKSFLPPMISSD